MSAYISDCGQYRYLLSRELSHSGKSGRAMLFVMLNPSTADATLDDPTIRRCKGFAEREGCGYLVVANLYALRVTNPAALWLAGDPVGPANNELLSTILKVDGPVVCAWGANAKLDRVKLFLDIAAVVGPELFCLGTTKSGAPRHPLYIKADQPLVPYAPGVMV